MQKKTFLLFIILFLFFYQLPVLSQDINLIQNGGFEEFSNGFPLYWTGSKLNSFSNDAYSGSRSLEINNEQSVFTEFSQTIAIDNSKKIITIAAYVKTENILPGVNSWDKAGITLTFFDIEGNTIDCDLGRWDGDMLWVYKINSFEIPKGAVQCKVAIALCECTGIVKVDDIQLFYGKINRVYNDENLLNNGEFEYGDKIPEDWTFWWYGIHQFASPGNYSNKCFYIKNEDIDFSHVSQTIDINPTVIEYIEVRADFKIRNVIQGENPGDKARIIVEFYDEFHKPLSNEPIIIDEASGTQLDWKTSSKWLVVPKEARKINMSCYINNTPGELWVDNCIIRGYDIYGNMVKRNIPDPIDFTNWLQFDQENLNPVVWPDIDISYLLDAPAGKHGFITNLDGETYFEDGTRARFWGVNIAVENEKITHEYSIRLAQRLASIGCNMMRLHLDLPDDENFDRLDFLIFQLIQRGIYVYLDVTYHKHYGEADGLIHDDKDLPKGLIVVSYFDEILIAFEKEHANKILNHYNPYLGRKYIDEPGLIALEMLNESSIFHIDRQIGLDKKYLPVIDNLFNDWLVEKYQSHENMISSWEQLGTVDISPDENLSDKNIKRAKHEYDYWHDWLINGRSNDCTGRASDTKRFYFDLQYDYYQEMYEYIRSIGYKGLITGSNHWERFDGDIYSNALLDHTDYHSYYDHPDPSAGFDPLSIIFKNKQVLKTLNNNISGIASVKIKEKPLFVTEWGIPYPNEYRFVGPVMMASYSCLQNWDGVLQVCFNEDKWTNKIEKIFDVSISPTILAQWIPAAYIFHNQYINQSRNEFIDYVGEDHMYDTNQHSFRFVGNDLALPLISRVRKSYTNSSSNFSDPSSVLQQYHDIENSIVTSDTEELIWNYEKGYIIIDNEYVQGIMGNFVENNIDFDDVSIQPYCSRGSIIILSMDGKPLKNSKKMLLITSSRELNHETEFNITNSMIVSNGFSPICLEPVVGTIDFRNRNNLQVEFYDITGKKNGWKADLRDYNNKLLFFKEAETMFYEINVKDSN